MASTTVGDVAIPFSGHELTVTPSGTGNNTVDGFPAPVVGIYSEDDPTTVKGGWPHPLFIYRRSPQISYPTGAAQGGTTTTTAASGANTYTWGTNTVKIVVQNNTAATIYVAFGTGTSRAATQGDYALIGSQSANLVLDVEASWISLYTSYADAVNNTSAGGIVVYGLV